MKWFSLPAALFVAASCASAQADLFSRWRGMSEDPAAPEAVMEADASPAPVEMGNAPVWNGSSTALAPECCPSPKASWCRSLWAGFCKPKCSSCGSRGCASGCGSCCGKLRGFGLKHFCRKPATPLFGGPCCRPACPCGYRSAASACCEPCCGALGCGSGCCGEPSCCGPRKKLLSGCGRLFDCLKPRFGHGLFGRCCGKPCETSCGCGQRCETSCGCGQPNCPHCGQEVISGDVESYGPEMPIPSEAPAEATPELNAPPADPAPAPAESKSARSWLLPKRFHLLPVSLPSH